ncbi:hypothetical protein CAPTEDRAFT_177566 [Capitella teleta]|uniref:Uncharacterized protein n=1 Tax=Capitella teleta TaxID=283909 RepID=R7U2K8_CAPTE|nr:hypothetical protein CAPTEDRAFT_177566 [Capitella teleta]|eukprot:ELT97400.1 hypothetical protein CAPTEDRAFT_177566 [Capitella teleta]
MKPQDDFTRWCESALKGLQTSVDVPTFIAFLKDVDSPYEVNDYVRSYLGDSPAAAQFSKEFIEKRSRHKNQQKHQEPEESMWGPAPAVNPNKGIKSSTLNNNGMSSNHNMKEKEVESEEARNKRRKKKMQKLDASSILGFTVQADPDRVNIGEIDTGLN